MTQMIRVVDGFQEQLDTSHNVWTVTYWIKIFRSIRLHTTAGASWELGIHM